MYKHLYFQHWEHPSRCFFSSSTVFHGDSLTIYFIVAVARNETIYIKAIENDPEGH